MSMMKTFPLRPSAHHGITAHEIRSPLAETTYGLRTENACLLVLQSGRGRVLSGARDMALEAPRFVWLAPGREGTLRLSPGSRGELVTLTKGALSRVLPGSAFGDELSQVLAADLSVPLGEQRERVVRRLAELREELAESAPGVEIMAGHMLSMLLVQLWRGVKEGRARPDVATGGLVQGFVTCGPAPARALGGG